LNLRVLILIAIGIGFSVLIGITSVVLLMMGNLLNS